MNSLVNYICPLHLVKLFYFFKPDGGCKSEVCEGYTFKALWILLWRFTGGQGWREGECLSSTDLGARLGTIEVHACW